MVRAGYPRTSQLANDRVVRRRFARATHGHHNWQTIALPMGGPRGPPADITNGVQFSPQRAAVRAVAMRKLAHELHDVAAKERIGRANRASHRSKCNNQQRMQKTRTQRAYVVP